MGTIWEWFWEHVDCFFNPGEWNLGNCSGIFRTICSRSTAGGARGAGAAHSGGGIPGYWDTGVLGYRGTGVLNTLVPGYLDIRTPGHLDTWTPGYLDIMTPGHLVTSQDIWAPAHGKPRHQFLLDIWRPDHLVIGMPVEGQDTLTPGYYSAITGTPRGHDRRALPESCYLGRVEPGPLIKHMVARASGSKDTGTFQRKDKRTR